MSLERHRSGRWLMLTAALAVTLGLARTVAAEPDAGAKASSAAPTGPFEQEIRAFETSDRIMGSKHARVVFIGSSSIRMWEGLGLDFPDHYVVNRGFGGSNLSDSVKYADRILPPHKPPLVVMYAGTNDIDSGKSAAAVAADFKAFTAKVWALFPSTSIAFISIATNPQRWSQVDRVREANRLIAAYCATDKRLTFIDIFPKMLGEDGRPRPELYQGDGLHMTRKGYLLWIPPVRAVLNAIVPPEQAEPKPAASVGKK